MGVDSATIPSAVAPEVRHLARKGTAPAPAPDAPAAGGGLVTHVGHGVREGLLILAVAFAGWLMLALGSFDAADPGWSHTGARDGVANLAGASGAWTADVLYALLGWFAWLLPGAFLFLAVHRFRTRRSAPRVDRLTLAARVAGFVLTLAAGCLLADLHLAIGRDLLPSGPGGILGRWLAGGTLGALGLTGDTLLSLAVFLLGITLFTGLSWIALAEATGRAAVAAVRAISERLRAAREARAERRRTAADQARRRENIEQAVERKQTRKPPEIAKPKPPPAPSPRVEKEKQRKLFDAPVTGELPSLEALDDTEASERKSLSDEALEAMSRLLEIKLKDFGVDAEVVAVHPGPVITRFEIQPAAGVKVARISGLAKDLARSLAVISVRVVEVIPGKSTVGVEVPNEDREIVRLREVLASREFDHSPSKLTLALGKDISGTSVVADLARMPHLLVAGTTGSGKSVGVNSMLLSLLYKAQPSEVRLILVDPKMLELSVYEGIPHLLTPVVTDMKEAASALRWCVAEMERRYRLMAALGVRNLAGFNRKVREAEKAGEPIKDPLWKAPEVNLEIDPPEHPDLEALPFIVVVIDEFADMMMIVGKKVEELIARIAQKARAAGIHLVLATQRPSVDVITGLIKANIPTRMSFQVSSKVDSRTILDQGGAEQLLGHGDMLYLPPGTAVPIRVHGAFVGDDEVHRVVADWKRRGEPDYLEEILDGGSDLSMPLPGGEEGGDVEQEDALYDEAVAYVLESRRASIDGGRRRGQHHGRERRARGARAVAGGMSMRIAPLLLLTVLGCAEGTAVRAEPAPPPGRDVVAPPPAADPAPTDGATAPGTGSGAPRPVPEASPSIDVERPAPATGAPDVLPRESAAASLTRRLEALARFSADFEQILYDGRGEILRRSSGHLRAARPDRFRWRVDAPFAELLVGDGRMLWLWDPDLEQVTVRPYDERLQATPARLLTGSAEALADAFTVDRVREDERRAVYVLTPRRDGDGLFDHLELIFADDLPRALVIHDGLGQRTEVRFTAVDADPPEDPDAFTFEVPEGADVLRESAVGDG
jgi:S-DNA-T family DNA segregation ATPase FtsK/SpoIIIE